MNNNRLLRLSTMWFLVITVFFKAGARVYTLEKLIETGIRNAKQLRSIEIEIEKAEAQVQETFGSAMPSVTASMNLSHAFKQYSPFADMGSSSVSPEEMDQYLRHIYATELQNYSGDSSLIMQLGPKITNVTLGQMQEGLKGLLETPSNTASLSLNLNQPIFAQGKVGIGIKIAKAHQRTLLCKYSQEKMKLKAQIITLFFRALLAQKNVAISSEAVSLAEQTHRLAIITHAVGKASELDTLSSLLNLENARIELQKTESDRRMTYEALITQTGLIEISSSFSVEGEFPVAEFDLELEPVLERVRKESPSIEQLRGTEEIQKQLVQLAITEMYPVVYAGASVGKIGQFEGFGDISRAHWGDDRKIFIGLSWTLFSGLSRNQKIRQAKADRDMFSLSEQQIVEALELAARNAYEQVVINRDRLSSMQSVINLAEKGYSIAKKAYEVGSKTLLDVQNAEHQLNSAKIGYNSALFAFHCAVVNLKLLMADL